MKLDLPHVSIVTVFIGQGAIGILRAITRGNELFNDLKSWIIRENQSLYDRWEEENLKYAALSVSCNSDFQ